MQGGVRVQPFYGQLEGSARVVYALRGATRCVDRARAKADGGEGVVVELRDRVGARGIHSASRPHRTSPYNGFGQAGGGGYGKCPIVGREPRGPTTHNKPIRPTNTRLWDEFERGADEVIRGVRPKKLYAVDSLGFTDGLWRTVEHS